MKRIGFIVVLLAIFPAMTAFATVKITDLYQADLPVSSQSADERMQAARQGLNQLLIKLTGNPAIEENPDIQEAIQRADYYVQEFSYSSPTTNSATYFVHLTFEQDDVKRLLRKAGISYWGERRPLILVWLAVTDLNHVPQVIGNETPGAALDAMRHLSKKFALPLIFPIMDVTDMSHVSTEEVSNMSLPALRLAGKRYSPNAYLIGNIEVREGSYQSQWQLFLNKDHWAWSITNKTVDEVIAQVLYQTSQTLSKNFQARS